MSEYTDWFDNLEKRIKHLEKMLITLASWMYPHVLGEHDVQHFEKLVHKIEKHVKPENPNSSEVD